jgi:hypothetical protein
MIRCPRCRQELPEPRPAFCMHCGAALPLEPARSDEPASGQGEPEGLPPGPTGPEAQPPPQTPPPIPPALPPSDAWRPADAGDGVPWERRGQLGALTALVDTTLQVLSRPRDFFRRMSPNAGLGAPLVYGVIVGYIGLVATAVYDAIFEAMVGRETAELGLGPEFDRALAMVQGGPGLLVQLLIGPFVLVVGLLVITGLNHLALMMLGGARHGFEATFRVGAYARAASIVSLVPLCGPVVAIVWTAVVSIIGIQVVHETTLGKAIGAVVLPVVVACCCCAGTIGLVAMLAASAAAQ